MKTYYQAIFSCALWAVASAAGGAQLYFTDPGFGDQVSRMNLDGSGLDVIISSPSIADPRGLAINPLTGQAYYTSGSTLERVNFDGSGKTPLGPAGASVPSDVELDVAGDKMYWSNDGGGATGGVRRAGLDGSSATVLVSQSILDPLYISGLDPLVRADSVSGIALDLAAGRVYWANGRSLNSMPLGGVGGPADATHHFAMTGPGDMAKIELAGSDVYWTNNSGSLVQKSALTGAGQTTLVSRGFGRPAGLAIDAAGDKLYFGDTLGTGGRGQILRSNLDGSDLLVIYDSGSTLFAPVDLELGPETAIPEPSLAVLLMGGVWGCCLVRTRRC